MHVDAGWQGFAAIDLETTGLYPRTDRVVEVAVVQLDRAGREQACWTTLVDPQRDIGPTSIHGISAGDVRGAPTFAQIASGLRALLAARTLVAHNAWFDLTFLGLEFSRAGLPCDPPLAAICTMTTCYSTGLTQSRRLDSCCAELGIDLVDHHTALADARRTAGLLAAIRARGGPPVPWPAPRPPAHLRSDPPLPRVDTTLGSLADRIGIPEGADVEEAAAIAYLGLLDRVLEDRVLTPAEVSGLAEVATLWNIAPGAAADLHRAYLASAWELARADGVVTPAELRDVRILAELLGVPLDAAAAPLPALPRPGAQGDFVGKSVCFTGESVCSIEGVPFDRAEQERLAADRGLIVKQGVSSKLDILVLADPDSQSGKARKARDLGVRRITEPVFWRGLGVPID